MFRNICNSALLAVMLLVLVAGNLQAQTQANANVGATATVLTALTITKNTDVAFGNVSATTAGVVYLNPQTLASSNYVGVTASVGKFTLQGATATSILIGWPANIDLVHAVTDHLNYSLKVTGAVLSTSQGSSSDLTSTNPATVTTAAGGDAVPGAYYLWVGGYLGAGATGTALSGQANGLYSGTANFTVEYN